MSPGSIPIWETFEKLFLNQFKIFINLVMIHHQLVSIKRDLAETISHFNHHFLMEYCKLETPYTIIVGSAIQIYLCSMDHGTIIFLRRLNVADIQTLGKVFEEVVTFTKHANPNRGGMMVPTHATLIVPPYHVGAQSTPSKFIPLNPIPLEHALATLALVIIYQAMNLQNLSSLRKT